MRSVRIDEKERPAISIEIAGQTFEIRRVVTGVRQRWGEFMQLQGQALEGVGQLKQKLSEAEDSETVPKNIQEEVERMNSYTEKIAVQRERAERECIQLILEKNGYQLDWPWWVDETDSIDRQRFIVEALNKDAGSGGKKKAVT